MYKYKKRRRSSWPSRLLAAGLVLGGSLVATSVFANCEGASEPITIAPGETKSCKIETGSDEDGFQFDAQSGYTYTISATDVGKDIDIALGLQCGDTKMQANRGFDGEDEVLDNYTAPVADRPVTCSLRVFLTGFFGWTNTGYQLSVTGEAPTVEPQLEIKLTPEVTQPLQVTAGTDSQAIVFQVTDKNNNGQPVSGQTIQFSLLNKSDESPASGYKTTPDPATTGANGQISLVLTAPATAGDYKIKAEILNSTATPVEVEVNVANAPVVPTKLKLTADGNGCANSPELNRSCTMTFEILDASGNKIDSTGKTVSFVVTPSAADSIVKDCVVSLENGQVKCKLTPDKAGSYTIASATVDRQSILFDPATLPVVVVKVATSTLTLTAKDNLPPTATVKSSYTVTFILTENGTPKGGESVHFEMTTKPPGSNSQLETTVDKPTDATGEVSVSFKPDIEGQYVITATGAGVSGTAEVTASVGQQPAPTLGITPCDSPSVGTACSFTFTLTNGNTSTANTINVSRTKSGSSNPENLSNVTMAAGANSGSTDLTFDLEGNYTITATLATDNAVTGTTSVTVSPASPPPPQPTYSLTVVGGGNQSVVQGQKSQSITFQLKETGTDTSVPDKKIEIALTVPNVLDDQTSALLVNVALSPPVLPLPSPTTVIQTNSKGEATVEVSFEKKTDMTGVTTYLLSAKLKDNPGVTDYTNMFLLKEPLDNLLTSATITWPILQEVNDDSTLKTGGTGAGSAVDKEGQSLSTTTIFHGGLNSQQQAIVNLSDKVTVQGVIEVDSTHLGQVADIVVFGANDSPDGLPGGLNADGCYMLGNSSPVGILLLSSDKACLLGVNEVSKLVPFRRGVTLADGKILVEMYTGTFVYPASPLKIYFGYRLADGTLVYNGSNPIYITIEEK